MKRAHATMIAGAALLAVTAGWFRPVDPPTDERVEADSTWRLPDPADLERSSAERFSALRGIRWLGDDGGGNAPQRMAWTLVGLVGPADDPVVLVRSGKPALIKQFRAGDTLPDGSTLVSVGSGGIVVELDGCRTQRPLYPAAQDARADARGECAPAGSE